MKHDFKMQDVYTQHGGGLFHLHLSYLCRKLLGQTYMKAILPKHTCGANSSEASLSFS